MQKMEKCKKENRMLHMKYPAPYSQSWSVMGHSKRSFIADKNSNKTISGIDNFSKKYCDRKPSPGNKEPPHRFTGLDPTVPHLKYGLFPKKIYISRGHSRILTVKPSVRITPQTDNARRDRVSSPKMPRIVEPKRLKNEWPAKGSTVQKFLKNQPRAQGESSEAGPVFVFRPLEHHNLRSLTVSASTHLDIKPRPQRGLLPSSQLYTKYI